MFDPVLATAAGDTLAWLSYLVGMSAIVGFWYVVLSRLGSF